MLSERPPRGTAPLISAAANSRPGQKLNNYQPIIMIIESPPGHEQTMTKGSGNSKKSL